MLKYSTNFTANQIFLVLGASKFGAPATVSKGQEAMRNCLSKRVGWNDFHVEEGSGLSRRTRVTAAQMTQLLRRFDRYSFLLPDKEGLLAKTGTLRGVNTLAGYFDLGGSTGQARFCILINSDVPPTYKFRVANEIRNYLKERNN
jgi:D-alanyl-D-alanine carboxypeptidase/D-alanyl-D-alanine-endopeptidase (penicillin-binding protein 4)